MGAANKINKILIVDDDEDTRAVLKAAIRRLNAGEPTTAKNGLEALVLVEKQDFDLIICDWKMPKMSGLEFFKKVREMPAGETVPFIMLTAEASKSKVIQALGHGVNDYIVKPWTMEVLATKIVQWMVLKRPAS